MRYIIVFLTIIVSSVLQAQIPNEAGFVPSLVDVTSGCTLSASHTFSASYPVSNARDRNIATFWMSPSFVNTVWIECAFSTAKTVNGYGIRSVASGSIGSPRDFSFEYHDGSSWVSIDTQIDATNTNIHKQVYVTPTTTSDRFRLLMTRRWGNEYAVREIYLFQTVFSFSPNNYIWQTGETLTLNTAGAEIEFDIEAGGFVLLGKWDGDVEVCVDSPSMSASCLILASWSGLVDDAFAYSAAHFMLDWETVHDVTITTLSSDDFRFDGINIIEQISAPVSSGGGGSTTITHQHIYEVYDPLASQTSATREIQNFGDSSFMRDFSITTGEIVIGTFLIIVIVIQLTQLTWTIYHERFTDD